MKIFRLLLSPLLLYLSELTTVLFLFLDRLVELKFTSGIWLVCILLIVLRAGCIVFFLSSFEKELALELDRVFELNFIRFEKLLLLLYLGPLCFLIISSADPIDLSFLSANLCFPSSDSELFFNSKTNENLILT